MAEHNDFGRIGEIVAMDYLKGCGYAILDYNWRSKHKEIDIVCTDGKVIVVVEVKTRRVAEERPDGLLDYRKRRNLLEAGAAYIKQKGLHKELRFDLIIVVGGNLIQHIKEAIQIFD